MVLTSPSGTPRLAPRRRRSFASLPARAPGASVLRLPIPDEIVRRVEFGLEAADAGREAPAWWKQIEVRMAEFVEARLPAGAEDVELTLDDEALEVVARFRLPA